MLILNYVKSLQKIAIDFRVFTMLTFLLVPMAAQATLTVLDGGDYVTPEGWNVIGTYSPVDLRHGSFFAKSFSDDALSSGINIVFHDIYNGDTLPNTLEVFLFDTATVYGNRGWLSGTDDSGSNDLPTWVSGSYTLSLGMWSDSDAGQITNDLVFSLHDPLLISNFVNGSLFGIGIDPDCHFYGSSITIESSVPEPTTLILIGSGLAGLGWIRRKS